MKAKIINEDINLLKPKNYNDILDDIFSFELMHEVLNIFNSRIYDLAKRGIPVQDMHDDLLKRIKLTLSTAEDYISDTLQDELDSYVDDNEDGDIDNEIPGHYI